MLYKLSLGALACALMLPATAWADTFTVNHAGDAPDHVLGDGVCHVLGGGCTLRAAIEQANALPGPHTIAFDFGGAPTTIGLTSQLPTITRQIAIDGTTNGGTPNAQAVGNDAVVTVRIDGAAINSPHGGEHGLVFGPSGSGGASGSVLRGVAVTRFSGVGVVVSGNSGIGGAMTNVTGVTLAGNFIGLDLDGTTPLPNGAMAIAIQENASDTIVGGPQPADRNLIVSDGSHSAIAISATLQGGLVAGNYIGTGRTGNALLAGTHTGISLNGARNVTLANNVIGAQDVGVHVGNHAEHTRLHANRIGVGTGGAPIAGAGSRHGVFVTSGSGVNSPYETRIGSTSAADANTIAHWGGNGVRAEISNAGASNMAFIAILGNSIYATGGEGIEQIDTVNGHGTAPGSRAPGSITGLPRPVITSTAGGMVHFALTDGPWDSTLRFELFASTECHASGWGAGRTFLGAASVQNGAGGQYNGSLALPSLPAGAAVLTMTASIDYGGGPFGTSEFSQCAAVQGASPGGGAVAVPTLGHAGLTLLSLGLAGLGALRWRGPAGDLLRRLRRLPAAARQ